MVEPSFVTSLVAQRTGKELSKLLALPNCSQGIHDMVLSCIGKASFYFAYRCRKLDSSSLAASAGPQGISPPVFQALRFLALSTLAIKPVTNCGMETTVTATIDSGHRFNEPPPEAMARD